MLQRLIQKAKRKFGIPILYKSETAKVRHLVLPYCIGYGCDIGFGGDKIKKDAIGIDFKKPYAYTGKDKVDIACDVMNENIPVPDNSFDYIYTSHLIEDFLDTSKGIKEFIRITKNGGNLILVFPDQKKYEQYCQQTGQPVNQHHKHADMGLVFMDDVLKTIPGLSYTILYQNNCDIDYNVILVAKIFKDGKN